MELILIFGVVVFFILLDVVKMFAKGAFIVSVILTILFMMLMFKFGKDVLGDGYNATEMSCSCDFVGN